LLLYLAMTKFGGDEPNCDGRRQARREDDIACASDERRDNNTNANHDEENAGEHG
jgi:hypothetical protein